MLLLHTRKPHPGGCPDPQAGTRVQTPPLAPSIHDPHGPGCPCTPLPGLPPAGGARAPPGSRRVGGIHYGHSKPQITLRTLPLPLPLGECAWRSGQVWGCPAPQPLPIALGRPRSPLQSPQPPTTCHLPSQAHGLPFLLPGPGGAGTWRHSPPGPLSPPPHPTLPGEAGVPTGVGSRAKGHTAGCGEAGRAGSSPHPAVGTERVTGAQASVSP